MTSPAIRVAELHKRYPDVHAVRGIDLTVQAGECFGLLGPNGAGKTTTVEILEGLTPADDGEVELLGMHWGRGQDQSIRERIGVQLQETYITDRIRVREVVQLFRSFYPKGRPVQEVIELLGLEAKADSAFISLSGGQKQRLALACALVSEPDIVFLDEPTTGLDPQARRRIWDVVRDTLARGATVFLTTHYMEEAAQLCTRLAIMDQGQIIAQGTPSELVASLEAPQVIELTTTSPVSEERLCEIAGVKSVRTVTSGDTDASTGSYRISTERVGVTLSALPTALESAGARIHHLSTHEATLEDVFLSLTGKALRE